MEKIILRDFNLKIGYYEFLNGLKLYDFLIFIWNLGIETNNYTYYTIHYGVNKSKIEI